VGSPLDRPLPVLVGALAVARLTRLLITDEITDPVRTRIAGWAEGTAERRAHPQIGYLVTCPWCVSIWTAAGWAGLAILAPGPAAALGSVLAWSEVAGILADLT
jgi:hypothetical protein